MNEKIVQNESSNEKLKNSLDKSLAELESMSLDDKENVWKNFVEEARNNDNLKRNLMLDNRNSKSKNNINFARYSADLSDKILSGRNTLVHKSAIKEYQIFNEWKIGELWHFSLKGEKFSGVRLENQNVNGDEDCYYQTVTFKEHYDYCISNGMIEQKAILEAQKYANKKENILLTIHRENPEVDKQKIIQGLKEWTSTLWDWGGVVYRALDWFFKIFWRSQWPLKNTFKKIDTLGGNYGSPIKSINWDPTKKLNFISIHDLSDIKPRYLSMNHRLSDKNIQEISGVINSQDITPSNLSNLEEFSQVQDMDRNHKIVSGKFIFPIEVRNFVQDLKNISSIIPQNKKDEDKLIWDLNTSLSRLSNDSNHASIGISNVNSGIWSNFDPGFSIEPKNWTIYLDDKSRGVLTFLKDKGIEVGFDRFNINGEVFIRSSQIPDWRDFGKVFEALKKNKPLSADDPIFKYSMDKMSAEDKKLIEDVMTT